MAVIIERINTEDKEGSEASGEMVSYVGREWSWRGRSSPVLCCPRGERETMKITRTIEIPAWVPVFFYRQVITRSGNTIWKHHGM
jgi:hypothetical protein